jgi:hypothetical protein
MLVMRPDPSRASKARYPNPRSITRINRPVAAKDVVPAQAMFVEDLIKRGLACPKLLNIPGPPGGDSSDPSIEGGVRVCDGAKRLETRRTMKIDSAFFVYLEYRQESVDASFDIESRLPDDFIVVVRCLPDSARQLSRELNFKQDSRPICDGYVQTVVSTFIAPEAEELADLVTPCP